jgi:stringent starvation protein B
VAELSTKPYLVRAIHEWCIDSGYTPYLAVKVSEQTQVPQSYVKDGEIVLSLSASAARHLYIGNDEITCGMRFGGVHHDIYVPMSAVIGIFAKETGLGLVFQGQDAAPIVPVADADSADEPPPPSPTAPSPFGKSPHLRVVK